MNKTILSLAVVALGLAIGGPSVAGGTVADTDHELALDCHDLFNGGTPAACCPEPAPNCTVEPDGYPGYFCVDRNNQFCACSCQGGLWLCEC
jgi:hypothetical protein